MLHKKVDLLTLRDKFHLLTVRDQVDLLTLRDQFHLLTLCEKVDLFTLRGKFHLLTLRDKIDLFTLRGKFHLLTLRDKVDLLTMRLILLSRYMYTALISPIITIWFEPAHDKRTIRLVRPAKTQISLYIR